MPSISVTFISLSLDPSVVVADWLVDAAAGDDAGSSVWPEWVKGPMLAQRSVALNNTRELERLSSKFIFLA
jgi:hypothetical protein